VMHYSPLNGRTRSPPAKTWRRGSESARSQPFV